MKKRRYILFAILCLTAKLYSQQPWNRPLKMAWSNDGITFNPPTLFQDSSGVPSVIRWKGDTLICAFQWFRQPIGSLSWDRVAVKFSYDNGGSWTTPTPIVVNGLPTNYQRPFDPTLVVFATDSIRIYFSSSDGVPMGGLDSTVNAYSAKSNDGIHYTFEDFPRVDEASNRVIDPAVIQFKNGYHYISPIGSPQQGAYHYVSPNGIQFTKVPDIPSDNSHNWTGNYMLNDTNELRFYGAGGAGIWYNSTPNGGVWNGYVNTNIQGGDPSVVRLSTNNYLMVYVGESYATEIPDNSIMEGLFIYPNPTRRYMHVEVDSKLWQSKYRLQNMNGKTVLSGMIESKNTVMDLVNLAEGIYLLYVGNNQMLPVKVIKN